MLSLNDIKNIKKSDLHVHLNGAIPKEIIINKIKEQNIIIPSGFNLNSDLQIKSPVKSLSEYFLPWQVLKLLPRDYFTLYEMVEKTFEKLLLDNIKYVEFRNSPFYISKLNDIPLAEAISWLVTAINENSIKFSIDARLILSITRHDFEKEQGEQLLKAIKVSNRFNIIVGVDMSGNEDYLLPMNISNFFLKAKEECGLKVTIHAGETGNYENINWAIEECKADRVGHGCAANLSKYTLNLIKERDTCLEVCLNSNIMSGNCKDISSHAIKEFLEWDIPFVLCTDNPSVHDLTLSEEYLMFLKYFHREDIIKDMENRNQKYSFS